MRICWFTNVPFPNACRAAGRSAYPSGGWLSSLGEALLATGNVELLVVSFVLGGSEASVRAGGCDHELIAIEPKRFLREWCYYPSTAVRRKCSQIVARFRPDVVHINGTEGSYGLLLAEGDIRAPAVVSIQGVLRAVAGYYCGGISFRDRWRSFSIRDLIRRDGLVQQQRELARRAQRVERRILQLDALFVGRTQFDEAYLRAVNPYATYYHSDEVLRPPFYTAERDPNQVVPYAIFTSTAPYPLKGFHCLLKAVGLLKQRFPQIAVRVLGSPARNSWRATGYQKYLHGLIGSLGLEDHVVPLGELDADGVARELARAHVFAFPSFADNSPNSLGEAMLVGVPVVVSFAGGMPSMVRDRETALCFPLGDETVMAECIRTVFTHDHLAQRLAQKARQVALARHDPQRIARKMLEIYAAARRRQTTGGGRAGARTLT